MFGRIGWMLALAVACGKDDTGSTIVPPPEETGTTPPDDTDTYVPPPPGPELVVTAAENYVLTQDLTIAATSVRSGGDVLVNWGGDGPALVDMFGQPLTASSVKEFWLMEIYHSSSEVAAHIEKDDLGFDLISTWSVDVLGDTSTHTNQLLSGGQPFDPVSYFLENDDKTWVAALMVEDADGRLQPRQYLALDPVSGAATSAQINSASSTMTWSAKLGSGLTTQAGWPSKDPEDGYYRVDWGGLGNDALGKPYDKRQGDLLFFGKVDGLSAADLTTHLMDLKAQSSVWYEMDVYNEDDARLDLARTDEGVVFRDFTAGSWVIGVTCSTCLAPFPLWLTTLEVLP